MGGIDAGFVKFCREHGVDVVEMPGWQSRGEGGYFDIRGVLLHHDAMGLHNDNVPQFMSQNGESGSQLWIKYTGQLYVLAAGLKWHAGAGRGFRNIPANGGNAYCAGIETDYSGSGARPVAIDKTIHLVTKCLVNYYRMDPQNDLALHKEYAPDRKIDLSNFDANSWRALAGQPFNPEAPKPEPEIPEEEEVAASLVRDVGTGWIYAIAPDMFQNISEKDAQGVNRVKTGQDAGLYTQKILDLNWVQIRNVASDFVSADFDSLYVGTNPDGSPNFMAVPTTPGF